MRAERWTVVGSVVLVALAFLNSPPRTIAMSLVACVVAIVFAWRRRPST